METLTECADTGAPTHNHDVIDLVMDPSQALETFPIETPPKLAAKMHELRPELDQKGLAEWARQLANHVVTAGDWPNAKRYVWEADVTLCDSSRDRAIYRLLVALDNLDEDEPGQDFDFVYRGWCEYVTTLLQEIGVDPVDTKRLLDLYYHTGTRLLLFDDRLTVGSFEAA
jgi:hypothetical protein